MFALYTFNDDSVYYKIRTYDSEKLVLSRNYY